MSTFSEEVGFNPGPNAIALSDDVRYVWLDDEHTIQNLWVWHNCQEILPDDSIMPGAKYGWRPSGVGNHTLIQEYPLTIVASVLWPCCGLHGFITDGVWRTA